MTFVGWRADGWRVYESTQQAPGTVSILTFPGLDALIYATGEGVLA